MLPSLQQDFVMLLHPLLCVLCFLLLFNSTHHSLSLSVSPLFIKLQYPLLLSRVPSSTLLGTPSYACSMYFWLGRIVGWSGSFDLPLLLNRSLGCCLSRSFSITNPSLRRMCSPLGPLHSAPSSKGCGLEMFLKGSGLGERCRAKSFRWLPGCSTSGLWFSTYIPTWLLLLVQCWLLRK